MPSLVGWRVDCTSAHDPLYGYAPRLGDKSMFPEVAQRPYFNHAAISPPSLAVRNAVDYIINAYAWSPMEALLAWRERRTALRHALARLVGADPEDVAFVSGTTDGVRAIALCFPWKRGDRILLFAGDFPANVTPWQRAAELFDLDIRFASFDAFERAAAEGLDAVDAELAAGVRLVAISEVRFQTGLRLPIEALAARCHAWGAELFVDAVQACGAVPIDVAASGVDYLCAGSHKWLMGLEGAGLLYVRRDRAAALRPALAGWLSHEDAPTFLFAGAGHLHHDRPIRKGVDFLEAGTMGSVALAALESSVAALLAIGVESIHTHVQGLLDRLEAELVHRGFHTRRAREHAARSTILSVDPPDGIGAVELHHALSGRGVGCAVPDGVLRFAPHWHNDASEVAAVVAATDAALAELRAR